jgi:disulfide bond formation protein DsbB
MPDEMGLHPEPNSTLWERLALAVAIALLAGSLYLSLGMELIACPLCLYERTFIMSVVGMLGLGLALRLPMRPGVLSLLGLPLAAGGLAVAAFHVYLDRTGKIVCPAGVLGIGHAPDQSLAGSVLLTALLAAGAVRSPRASSQRLAGSLGAALLGLGLAVAAVKSAPSSPPPNPTFGPNGERIVKGCEPALPADYRRPSGRSGR